VESLVAGYSDLDILKGVSIRVDPREVVTIIGPNGAGKSTLLKAIVGLVRVRSGAVRLEGREITGTPPDRVIAQGVGYVPQVNNVFPTLTVEENLDVGAFLRRDGVEEARQRVLALFPALAERRRQRVGGMSGGERQMVAIGRALMLEPRVLLLDEPSANLSPRLQEAVFDRIQAVARAGTPVLLVEQNARRALSMSTRGYVLENGRNRFEGAGAELLADPKLGRLYLGQ
jgi:ABC-type branched-subunit amino acid transport system ATPase component